MNEKMIGAYLYAQAKLRMAKDAVVETVRDAFTDETGEVNVVAIVVLIGVAVVLALAFKDKITEVLSTLFEGITKNVDGTNNDPNQTTTFDK